MLEFLPDNKRIKTRVTTLDGTIASDTADADADVAAAATAATTPAAVDWATLLPGGSVLQLLYTMQLVDERVGSAKTGAGSSAGGRNPQGSGDAASRDAEDAEHRRAWCDAFVEQGGFQHLYGRRAAVSCVVIVKRHCANDTMVHGCCVTLQILGVDDG